MNIFFIRKFSEKPRKGDGKKENRYSYSRRYSTDKDDAGKDSGNGDNERYINVSDDDYDNEKENLREAQDDNENDDDEGAGVEDDGESSKYTSDVFGADDIDGGSDEDDGDGNDKGSLKAVTDGKGYANKIGRNIYESYIVHNSPKGGANGGDEKKAVSQSFFQLGKLLLKNDDADKDEDDGKKKKADYTHASYESADDDGEYDGDSDHSSYGYDVDHDDDGSEGGDDGEHYQSYAREYDDDGEDSDEDDY